MRGRGQWGEIGQRSAWPWMIFNMCGILQLLLACTSTHYVHSQFAFSIRGPAGHKIRAWIQTSCSGEPDLAKMGICCVNSIAGGVFWEQGGGSEGTRWAKLDSHSSAIQMSVVSTSLWSWELTPSNIQNWECLDFNLIPNLWIQFNRGSDCNSLRNTCTHSSLPDSHSKHHG